MERYVGPSQKSCLCGFTLESDCNGYFSLQRSTAKAITASLAESTTLASITALPQHGNFILGTRGT